MNSRTKRPRCTRSFAAPLLFLANEPRAPVPDPHRFLARFLNDQLTLVARAGPGLSAVLGRGPSPCGCSPQAGIAAGRLPIPSTCWRKPTFSRVGVSSREPLLRNESTRPAGATEGAGKLFIVDI